MLCTCAVVREYVIALFSPEELVALQQKVVDAFCQNRPCSQDPLIHCGKIWRTFGEPVDDCGRYVNEQISHHIKIALDLDDSDDSSVPQCAHSWACHWPGAEVRPDMITDAVVMETWLALSSTRLWSLFEKAVAAEDWWLAVCVGGFGGFTLTAILESGEGFNMFFAGKLNNEMEAWFDVLPKVLSARPPQLTTAQHESWELRLRMFLIPIFAKKVVYGKIFPFLKFEEYADNTERVVYLLENTDAGRRDPNDAATMGGAETLNRRSIAGEFLAHDQHYLKGWQTGMTSALREGQGAAVQKHINSAIWHSPMLRLPEWNWDLMDRAFEECTIDPHMITGIFPDEFYSASLGLWPALRGDIPKGNHLLDEYIRFEQSFAAGEESFAGMPRDGGIMESFQKVIGPFYAAAHFVPLALYTLGRDQDAADYMKGVGLTWETAESVAEMVQSDVSASVLAVLRYGVRKKGTTEGSPYMTWSEEDVVWSIKLQYVLVTTWREVPPADVVAALPSPEVLDSYCGDISSIPGMQTRTRNGFASLTLLAALVCEKLEKPDDALLYVAKALRTEPRENFVKARVAAVEAAVAEIITNIELVKKAPEPIQEQIRGAMQAGAPGLRQLVKMTLDSPQTTATAGKSDAFKAEVEQRLLSAGDFIRVLQAQFSEVELPEGAADAVKEEAQQQPIFETEIDPSIDTRPTTITQGQALRGRALAAQGQTVEAEVAFEEAARVAHSSGLRLYELFAVRQAD